MTGFAELVTATNYSFLRGASHPSDMVARAIELGMTGIGIADRNTVAGVVRAWEAAREHGVHLIIGAEFQLADGPKLIALARDRTGYNSLCRVITRGPGRECRAIARMRQHRAQ